MDRQDVDAALPAVGPLAHTVRTLLRVGLVLSFLLGVGWAIQHWTYQRATISASRNQLVAATTAGTAAIDKITRHAMAEVDTIVRELDAGTLDRTSALARLRAGMEANPDFFGMSLTYRPFGWAPHQRLYSAYYPRKNGDVTFVRLDEAYDYTRPEFEWYGCAMANGPLWTRPYFDEAAATTMITYSRPFCGPAGDPKAPLGVVTLDISMDGIRKIIEALDLGQSGFGALVAADGTYLYHPETDFVQGHKTLQGLADELNDPDRLRLAAAARKGEAGIINHRSLSTGLPSWIIFAPVSSTGWSLENTFIKDDVPIRPEVMKQQQIRVLLAGLVFLLCAAGLLLGVCHGANRPLWGMSIVSALLFLAAIGCILSISLRFDRAQKAGGIPIGDRATLNAVTGASTRACELRHTEPPVYIPTGLYLESATFLSANDLMVSGYVWQKYQLGTQDHLFRGFTLADATSLESTENYREKRNGFEFVRWHFRATVRQHLDSARYPIETELIELRLLHKQLDHNTVLVPDLSAYRFANPTSLPGLAKDLKLPGWQLQASAFEFRKLKFDTNFGVERSFAKEDLPSLFFGVTIRRNIVDACLSNLLPLGVVTFLLFILVMIASRDARLVGFTQAGVGRVLNICAAMLFVIAFRHVDIRSRIASGEIFYLEYIYFLEYFAILWVSVNAVLYATTDRFPLIHYRDNFLAKALFWPVLLGALFVITLAVFY